MLLGERGALERAGSPPARWFSADARLLLLTEETLLRKATLVLIVADVSPGPSSDAHLATAPPPVCGGLEVLRNARVSP